MEKLLIKNFVLIDKRNGLPQAVADILCVKGKIEKIGSELEVDPDTEILDATGCYVSAGMIDIHMHNRLRTMTMDADDLGVCRGVTAMIECGSAAVDEAEHFVAEAQQIKTKYYALLSGHSEHGFSGDGVEMDADALNEEDYLACFDRYPEYFLGIKVACSNTITNDQGYSLVKKAKAIASQRQLPLTVHVGTFPPDPCGLVEFLEAGDVITHTYHGKEISLFKPDGTPKRSFIRARERGVLFDVGHGSASYSYPVAARASRKGFLPDLISTDIRKVNIHGPVISLAVVMSKWLALGMKLEDVVDCVTYQAAKAYHLHELGEIAVGKSADFTLFKVQNVNLELVDCYYNLQPVNRLIEPIQGVVSRGGESECIQCSEGHLKAERSGNCGRS